MTLLDRIINGEAVRFAEIYEQNARMCIGRVKKFQANPCTHAGGTRRCNKYCDHGQSTDVDIAYAVWLNNEAERLRKEEL